MTRHTDTLLNFLAICSAIAAIYFDYHNQHTLFTIFKPLTTIFVILVAVSHYKIPPKTFAPYILIGLIFCLIGDTFLLYETGFIYGLVAFLIAHILFSISFIKVDGLKKYGLVAVFLIIYLGVFYHYIRHNLAEMRLPVIIYMLVISFMVWQGMSLCLWQRQKAFAIIAIAVVLFMISDSVLAVAKFKFLFKEAPIYILSTYWASIILLANALKHFKHIE